MGSPNPQTFTLPSSTYSFTVRFGAGDSPLLRALFQQAAERWLRIITTHLRAVNVEGAPQTGVFIDTSVGPLDGEFEFSVRTELTHLRPQAGDNADYLPAQAVISLDEVDVGWRLAAAATNPAQRRFMLDLITHELGHALGFSKHVWTLKNLWQPNVSTDRPVFTGGQAMAAYSSLAGTSPTAPVRLDATGSENHYVSHWQQFVFNAELMTFVIEMEPNLIGLVTIGALRDLGYQVTTAGRETDILNPGTPPQFFMARTVRRGQPETRDQNRRPRAHPLTCGVRLHPEANIPEREVVY